MKRPFAPENEYVKDHCFIKKDGVFHCFSISGKKGVDWHDNRDDSEITFSHLVSSDLEEWSFEGHVIERGAQNSFDTDKVWAPFVIEKEEIYYMFYVGVLHKPFGPHPPNLCEVGIETINIAFSHDLYHWVKWARNPALSSPVACRPGHSLLGACRDPHVFYDTNRKSYLLYYTTHRTIMKPGENPIDGEVLKEIPCVGLAESKDLISWYNIGIIREEPGWVTESVFALTRENKYYMFFNDGISVSDNPLFGWSKITPYLDGRCPVGEILYHNGKWLRSFIKGKRTEWRIDFCELLWEGDNCRFIPLKRI